ncbi:GNAT family N-acetyltransferase [Streptococcus danieliae]|uniref:GNAT family N-acetyltransferase n=1 Tax=Streptococcus danieliae TaxID=747656 RepID=A0A7X3G942_9STRE|nr:GNAT family N-acetyltransferase [Streptococcus danieliae]MVX59222.1 GNAT family N-acetyltransferase [Streptococcus danieliae]
MSIRQAETKDIPAILSLLGEILAVHHQERPDIFKASGSKYTSQELDQIITRAEQMVFVYEEEGQILGHLFCQIQEPHGNVLQPIKTLFIDDLCVASTARGRGVGQQLFAFAKQYARDQDCYNLTLDVWTDNAAAIRFYQRLGLQSQKIRMEEIL